MVIEKGCDEVRTAATERGERDAAALLSRTWTRDGIRSAFPVDPIIIARDLNIEVLVSSDMRPNASGVLVMEMTNEELHTRIYLNSRDARVRQRFSCAHEIGHYMDRIARGEMVGRFVDWRDERSSTGTRPEEVYANSFAAALLMPADTVLAMRQDSHPVQMALFFDVSPEAMTNRLNALAA